MVTPARKTQSNHQNKMKTYRISEDGEHYWTGRAFDMYHALEKCYDDGGPGSLVTVTVEVSALIKVTKRIETMGWRKIWQGQYCDC